MKIINKMERARPINESEIISEYQPQYDQPEIEDLNVQIYQEEEESKLPFNQDIEDKDTEDLERLMIENMQLEEYLKTSVKISKPNDDHMQKAKQSVLDLF